MMAVSDSHTILCMIWPSEVRMLGIDFALSCLAWWSFVISRKLIFYSSGCEKSGISERRAKSFAIY
jgi:hypothetical protein